MRLKVDGLGVYVATGGREAGVGQPAILLLHGAGMDHTAWQMQSRYLAHHAKRVIAPDLPGHGRSDGVALESIEAIADWTARLIEAAELENVALAGHSMGALVALDCAARYPERVRSLALIAIADAMPVHPDLLAAARENSALAPELITDWGFAERGHFGGHPVPGMWMVAGGQRLLEHAPPGVLATDLVACDAYLGTLAAAAELRCPTHLILGANDRMTPVKKADALIAALAQASQDVVEGCGHMVVFEAPDRVLNALKAME